MGVALTAGLEIVERHAHSQRVPGSMAATGRDATVFWNYVDLRLRAPFDWQIETSLTASELLVRFRALSAKSANGKLAPGFASPEGPVVESCETCGVTDCFRHPVATALPRAHCAAWLVDAHQPEHNTWLRTQHQHCDWLFTPLDSTRRG